MWTEITAPIASIILPNRRAFYYVKGQVADLPPTWAGQIISAGEGRAAADPEEPRYADAFIPPLLGVDLLTVAAVHKTGGRYDRADYAGKLARAVKRHLTRPHRFVLLTDGPAPVTDAVDEVVPLTMGWPGYWSKCELFRPGLINGPLLYLDLDTVIVGSLDELVTPDEERPLVAWDIQRGWLNSSFLLTTRRLDCVWEAMTANPAQVIAHYDSGNGPFHGDQGLLQDTLAANKIEYRWIQAARPHQVVWMPPGLRGSKSPAGTAIEMWYGDPKQPEVGGPWLAEHWV